MVSVPNKSPKKTPTSTPSSYIHIPEKEETLSSKAWLRRYDLNHLGLNFNSCISLGKCNHRGEASDARYNIRYIRVGGVMVSDVGWEPGNPSSNPSVDHTCQC